MRGKLHRLAGACVLMLAACARGAAPADPNADDPPAAPASAADAGVPQASLPDAGAAGQDALLSFCSPGNAGPGDPAEAEPGLSGDCTGLMPDPAGAPSGRL